MAAVILFDGECLGGNESVVKVDIYRVVAGGCRQSGHIELRVIVTPHAGPDLFIGAEADGVAGAVADDEQNCNGIV